LTVFLDCVQPVIRQESIFDGVLLTVYSRLSGKKVSLTVFFICL